MAVDLRADVITGYVGASVIGGFTGTAVIAGYYHYF